MQIFYVIILYLLFVWVILRSIVPYMGFRKARIAESVPELLNKAIEDIKANSLTQTDALRLSYDCVVQRYYGNRIKTVSNFWRAFGNCESKSAGFLPCNMQNQLLRTILVKSGFFTDSDIKIKVIPLNFFIHQYLQVRIGGDFIDVDPWSNFLGLGLGKKSSWFG